MELPRGYWPLHKCRGRFRFAGIVLPWLTRLRTWAADVSDRPMPFDLDRRSAPVRYGFALLAVAIALLVTLASRHFGLANRSAAFLAAILLTGWYTGTGPLVLSLVLSTFSFDFFFLPPLYTIGLEWGPDPYLVWFLLFALLAAWFSAARRRGARLLEDARNELEQRVAFRTAELERSEMYLAAATTGSGGRSLGVAGRSGSHRQRRQARRGADAAGQMHLWGTPGPRLNR